MSNPLSKISETSKSITQIFKTFGPFMLSQSKEASEAFTEHKMRLASVEAARDFMLREVEAISEVKKNLRIKFYDANIEDRIRIKRDLEEIDSEIRRLTIVSDALGELPAPQPSNKNSESNIKINEESISLHWIDNFNKYARSYNEDWRKDLLSKALAIEAKTPGRIGLRALWLIGTIDENIFHAYASLLDISIELQGEYILPNYKSFLKQTIPNCILGPDMKIGNLLFILSDLGLISDTKMYTKIIPVNQRFKTSYGTKATLLTIKKELRITGVIPTTLGQTIAKLYKPKPNELGLAIYDSWLESLNQEITEKINITIVE